MCGVYALNTQQEHEFFNSYVQVRWPCVGRNASRFTTALPRFCQGGQISEESIWHFDLLRYWADIPFYYLCRDMVLEIIAISEMSKIQSGNKTSVFKLFSSIFRNIISVHMQLTIQCQ